jgi:hypothetical protein
MLPDGNNSHRIDFWTFPDQQFKCGARFRVTTQNRSVRIIQEADFVCRPQVLLLASYVAFIQLLQPHT